MTDQDKAPEIEAENYAKAVEMAKLMQVRRLVNTMRDRNPQALNELLYRLSVSFKNRIILDKADTATPEEVAQALFTAVLMSALEVTPS